MILQLKTGRIEAAYFRRKFGVEVLDEFADAWRELEKCDVLTVGPKDVRVTPDGLLQIDRNLPAFFESEFRSARYA
jgi:oxygen-independent coproporphyrinogen-3 oxidase